MKVHIENFDIEQIANSGQCFRMIQAASKVWGIRAFNKCLQISEIDKENYEFDCSDADFTGVWFSYFDMDRDYGAIKKSILKTGDQYLIAASNYGGGIRILRQDPWETTVSFIISQRNNIPRIKNIISRLCEPYDNEFPTPTALITSSEKDFKYFGLGYREKYIRNVAEAVLSGDLNFEELKCLEYKNVVECLKKFTGIGNKVADCIALFGLHKIEAFPIDTWIQYIIDAHYNGYFNKEQFAGYAGIIQQYMFFYQRYLGKV